jgi:hypothetical protein
LVHAAAGLVRVISGAKLRNWDPEIGTLVYRNLAKDSMSMKPPCPCSHYHNVQLLINSITKTP